MNIRDGKKAYKNIEIPDELKITVKSTINKAEKNREKSKVKRVTLNVVRWTAAVAALCVAVTGVGVNLSSAFADEMSKIPVIGRVAEVMTVRSWHTQNEDFVIDVEVPGIEDLEDDKFTGDINKEIKTLVDNYVNQAQGEFEEYKKAFFTSGGTEAEWAGRTMDIDVDYSVKYQKGNVLSLEIVASKAWVNASEEVYYYNINLETKENIGLKDILGEDYITVCNDTVKQKIEDNLKEDNNLAYWGFGDDDGIIEGFKTVDDSTKFYINQNGNAVLVFDKYEIAPGYMGIQEFEIERTVSINIYDK